MVRFTVEDGKLVCHFARRLDSVNCAKWEEWLFDKVRETKMPVVFDLQKVNYIASAFLRVCVKVSKEIGSGNLSIINTCPYVKKVFKLSGFDKFLTIK